MREREREGENRNHLQHRHWESWRLLPRRHPDAEAPNPIGKKETSRRRRSRDRRRRRRKKSRSGWHGRRGRHCSRAALSSSPATAALVRFWGRPVDVVPYDVVDLGLSIRFDG